MPKKDLITTLTWSDDDIKSLIELAANMKGSPLNPRWTSKLSNKTFLMLFHNSSLRTHLSFEVAMNQLGGSAIYRTPTMGWIKTSDKHRTGETLKDAAKVMSRYVDGIGIRMALEAISYYGEGDKILSEYANYVDVPVINMANDKYHPCQGLADLMGWSEWYSGNSTTPRLESLKGKKILLTWAKSGLARPWCSVQSPLLLAARFGMHVTLAHPPDYTLDPEICAKAKAYCQQNNTTFEIVNDPDSGYEGAHVVYVRNWITKEAYGSGQFDYATEVKNSLAHDDWITTKKRMQMTNDAIFANPMPVDRGYEAEDEVVDDTHSIIYEVAENRLHVQKALLALTMG